MIDVNTFFYKDRTTSTQEIEEFFSKVRDQAANKNFVDKAEGVIFIAYSNELKWIVQECMYLIKKKPKKDYYEELKIKENKGVK